MAKQKDKENDASTETNGESTEERNPIAGQLPEREVDLRLEESEKEEPKIGTGPDHEVTTPQHVKRANEVRDGLEGLPEHPHAKHGVEQPDWVNEAEDELAKDRESVQTDVEAEQAKAEEQRAAEAEKEG